MRLSLALLLAIPLACSAEEEAEKVFRTCNPSVVGLENLETSGSGIIVSTGGLILTNAHVLSSPLKYRVLVDVPSDKGTRTVVFKSAKVVGFHPTYDLALIRIDPAEQNVRLTPARIFRSKAGPGKRVYAIGNPSISGVTLTKSITDGMLSAADREVDGLKYYQFSAPINPGNSGGPLLDKDGNVLGLVTMKLTDADGVGFAIPLFDFDPKVFIPERKGGGNAQLADNLTQQARKYLELREKIVQKSGKDHEDARTCLAVAFLYLRLALAELPGSSVTWSNVGHIWHSLEKPDIATAYFVRSVQIHPWAGPGFVPYEALGHALVQQKNEDAGLLVWKEGVAKYPRDLPALWLNIAVYHHRKSQWEESAYHAACALKSGSTDKAKCNKVIAESKSKLDAEGIARLDARIAGAEQDLVKLTEAAAAALKAKKLFIKPEFEKFLKAYEDSNGMPADDKGVGNDAAAPAPDPDPANPATDAAKWIQSKMNMAKSYYKNGMDEKAVSLLQEILDKYPDHADAKEAKKLMDEWKRK